MRALYIASAIVLWPIAAVLAGVVVFGLCLCIPPILLIMALTD